MSNKGYKQSPEVLAEKHYMMKNLWKSGKIICLLQPYSKQQSTPITMKCGKTFFKDSEHYQGHMLFDHGILVPVCSTKEVKKLEWNTINGFAKREQRLVEKAEMQKGLKSKRRVIRTTFRRFWDNIDNASVV